VNQASSFDDALEWTLSPVLGVPVMQGDVSVTSTPALLFASSTIPAARAMRRIRIYNTHLTSTLGIFFLRASQAASGLVLSDSVRILPGGVYECVISGDMTMAAIASTGTIAANILAHDVF